MKAKQINRHMAQIDKAIAGIDAKVADAQDHA